MIPRTFVNDLANEMNRAKPDESIALVQWNVDVESIHYILQRHINKFDSKLFLEQCKADDCPHCNGVGQWPLDEDDAEFMDCPHCKGKGKV